MTTIQPGRLIESCYGFMSTSRGTLLYPRLSHTGNRWIWGSRSGRGAEPGSYVAIETMVNTMSKRSLRSIETQKKKARRTIGRAKVTRIQGNTAGVRKRLKKLAGKARVANAASA